MKAFNAILSGWEGKEERIKSTVEGGLGLGSKLGVRIGSGSGSGWGLGIGLPFQQQASPGHTVSEAAKHLGWRRRKTPTPVIRFTNPKSRQTYLDPRSIPRPKTHDPRPKTQDPRTFFPLYTDGGTTLEKVELVLLLMEEGERERGGGGGGGRGGWG